MRKRESSTECTMICENSSIKPKDEKKHLYHKNTFMNGEVKIKLSSIGSMVERSED